MEEQQPPDRTETVLHAIADFSCRVRALIGDLFGTKNVGVMTARQLSVVMPAAFVGPKVAAYFREKSMNESVIELSSKVDDSKNEQVRKRALNALYRRVSHRVWYDARSFG